MTLNYQNPRQLALQRFPIDDAQLIEMVRGAQSSALLLEAGTGVYGILLVQGESGQGSAEAGEQAQTLTMLGDVLDRAAVYDYLTDLFEEVLHCPGALMLALDSFQRTPDGCPCLISLSEHGRLSLMIRHRCLV